MNASRILIAGGTGFIGKDLISNLTQRGFRVSVLSRGKSVEGDHVSFYHWDIDKRIIDSRAFNEVDTIINLTGANIGSRRWTKLRKLEILESRVQPLHLLYENIIKNKLPIKKLINSSAVGFYGAVTSNSIFTEKDDAGTDFLANVCKKWESSIKPFEEIGIKCFILRLGVVLDSKAEAYLKMTNLIRWGINPAVGGGEQYFSWVALKDLIRLFQFLIDNKLQGSTYNIVSTEHITMREFANKLFQHFGRKKIFPDIPEWVAKIVLGELSSMLLKGSRVSNQKIINEGFHFEFDSVDKFMSST
jgi:uncharacterized protein (TIGR01777 family)